VNGHVLPGERLAHDTLDELVRVLVRFKSVVGSSPWLLKVSPLPPSRHRRCIAWVAPLGQADIKSAFKHIPVCPSQRWACGVAFKAKGTTFVCRHVSCPFGAVGSVHGWERVGAGIAFIARKYLKIATLRYVDDFFGPERSAHGPCARLESKLCTAVPPPCACQGRPRWRALCSVSGVWSGFCWGTERWRRTSWSGVNPYAFWGWMWCLVCWVWPVGRRWRRRAPHCIHGECGLTSLVSRLVQVARWTKEIERALDAGRLAPGAASKLAGKLSWAVSYTFRRFGRAMLRPLFDQRTRSACVGW